MHEDVSKKKKKKKKKKGEGPLQIKTWWNSYYITIYCLDTCVCKVFTKLHLGTRQPIEQITTSAQTDDAIAWWVIENRS